MDGEQFREWCTDNWSTDADIIDACQIDRRTLRRWRTTGPPERIINALKYWRGELRLWPGWIINSKGELCSPENMIFTPGILRARPYELALTREYRRQLRDLKRQMVALKAQLSEVQISRKPANDPPRARTPKAVARQ